MASEYETQRAADLEKICTEGNKFFKLDLRHDLERTVIRDNIMSAEITIHRPESTHNYVKVEGVEERVRKQSIVPGYINASSWGTGDYRDYPNSAVLSMIQVERYLRMMEWAIECLNKFNETIPEWTGVENSAQSLRYERSNSNSLRLRLNEYDAKAASRKKRA